MSSSLSSQDPQAARHSADLLKGNMAPKLSDTPDTTADVNASPAAATHDWLLRHRLKRVEETWAAVLEEECGPNLVALLTRLRQLCAPDGQAKGADAAPVLKLIEKLELSDAIKMSRAFALYFQLINIVEQHYEQQGQQKQYRAAYEDAAPSRKRPPLKHYRKVSTALTARARSPKVSTSQKIYGMSAPFTGYFPHSNG